ncbi:extracellular solute-binding protein [Azoarcus sp. L1K30]|uniref:extracellular solute-binding protein n=1 Tax=Azoarcus sp. L1K30 TaxID=2820277 RepID=UPI0032C21969
MLAWPGYADADIVKAFEDRTGVRVEVSFVDSDENLWARVNAPEHDYFDVFAVNTAELQRYIRSDLVRPVNADAITNRSRQLSRFRDLQSIPGLVHQGRVFAIPYTYAEMGLIYDRRQVTPAPDSIAALWDPRYRGKVIAYNGGTHNFALAAQLLGHANPFNLNSHDWQMAVDKLIALRRNVLAFYTQPQESVDLFTRHGAALLFANFGSQQVKLLEAAGADVGYVIPREGALAWLDCWAIPKGTRNAALAEAWINYTLEEQPGNALSTRQGLANTTQAAASGTEGAGRLVWLQPVEDAERRNHLWGRIMAGARTDKVMAP